MLHSKSYCPALRIFSLEDEYLFAQSAGQSADSLNCCQSQAVPTDNTAQEATMVYS